MALDLFSSLAGNELRCVRTVRRRGTLGCVDTSCAFESCTNRAQKPGGSTTFARYCQGHYRQAQKGDGLRPLRAWRYPLGTRCSFEGCGRPVSGRGLCVGHWNQQYDGKPLAPLHQARPSRAARECSWPGCDERQTQDRCRHHGQKARYLQMKYGLSVEQYLALPTACEVCGSEHDLHIDHCHTSGAVRGRLCGECNRALGMMGDDPDRILALASYIRSRRGA